jgi:hypothetical protein
MRRGVRPTTKRDRTGFRARRPRCDSRKAKNRAASFGQAKEAPTAIAVRAASNSIRERLGGGAVWRARSMRGGKFMIRLAMVCDSSNLIQDGSELMLFLLPRSHLYSAQNRQGLPGA